MNRNSLKRLDELQLEEHRIMETESDAGKLKEGIFFEYEKYLDGLQVTEELIKKADEVNRQGILHDADIRIGYMNNDNLMGYCEGIINDYSKVQVSFTKDRLLRASCTRCHSKVYDYDSYLGYRLCEHEVALVQRIQAYLKKNDIGDETDRKSALMLNRYKSSNAGAALASSDEKPFGILPYINISSNMIKLTFKLDYVKHYLIKNIPEFLDAVKNEKEYYAGGRYSIRLSYSLLRTEADRELYNFMNDYFAEEEFRNSVFGGRDANYVPAKIMPSAIILFGSQMDRLYSILSKYGMRIAVVDTEGKHMLQTNEAKFPVHLEITDFIENDLYRGIRVKGEAPLFIKGHRGLYYHDKRYLYCVNADETRYLLPLISSIGPDNRIDLTIGKNRISEFYNSILPVIRNYVVINDFTTETQKHIVPDPEIIFYLDMDRNALYLKGDIVYGDQYYDLGDAYELFRDEVKVSSARNQAKENAFIEEVIKYFPDYDGNINTFSIQGDDDRIFDFLDEGIDRFIEMGEVRTTERFQGRKFVKNIRAKVGVSVDSDLLNLTIKSDIPTEDLLDIIKGYREKRKYIKLKDGSFLKVLDNRALDEVVNVMRSTGTSTEEFLNGKAEIPVYRALYLDRMLEETEYISTDRDSRFRDIVRNFKTIKDQDFEVPESLRGVLKRYQREGYRFLKTLEKYGFGGILADDMGLGKTLQTIAVLLKNKEEGKHKGPSLIVSPASLVYNWGEEFRKFAPELKIIIVSGTAAEREKVLTKLDECDVAITSYDSLRRDIMLYENMRFNFMIIDEAQYIKNLNTSLRKAVKIIKARIRYALTGTPIENRLSELWSVFDFLIPGCLYTYSEFRDEFEIPIVKWKDEEALERLRRIIKPFILRRRKEEVLKDLPPKIEEVRFTSFEDDQRKLYDAQVMRMLRQIESQDEKEFASSKFQILSELTKTRQICCDPSLLYSNYHGKSAKREACIELLNSSIEGGHKALLFSQYTSMLRLLEKDLTRKGIPYYVITGETSKERRIELVNAFNEDEVPVFLISLRAGGTGLNLTGADIVIHYDPWWNIAVQNQATDRAHRIGQGKVVTEYKLIVKDTIEEKIMDLQMRKKELADDILSGKDISSSTITKEDLEYLLTV